jgi:hypothetical protein
MKRLFQISFVLCMVLLCAEPMTVQGTIIWAVAVVASAASTIYLYKRTYETNRTIY